ncbi:MAG: EVE domain-containing protein [Terriglobales bacterium]
MYFLLKTEPDVYSFADLQHDKKTVWDGITNAAAVKHLREMAKGDRLVIYHTGDERRAAGTATVGKVDITDPKTPLIYIKVGGTVKRPLTLAEIKAHPAFADSPLIKQGRLSVVPLTKPQYEILTGK